MLTGEKKTSGAGADKWIQQEIELSTPRTTSTPTIDIPNESNCDSSYPDFCIPYGSPDLDCGDISQKRFRVLQPDPHDFDRGNDV